MLRAGWAHASSYMLSVDSACVHRILLLTHKAVVLQGRIQKSTAIFANDNSQCVSMSSTEESGSSWPEQTHDVSVARRETNSEHASIYMYYAAILSGKSDGNKQQKKKFPVHHSWLAKLPGPHFTNKSS